MLAALLLAMIAAAASPAGAATFTVTVTADSDDGTCDAHCTLREAMTAANATAGLDTIEFNIPGAGVHVIMITLGELPQIDEAVLINGYTQPGASENTQATGGLDTQLRIQIQSPSPFPWTAGTVAFRIFASGVTIRGLAITNFTGPIFVDSWTHEDITIAGNFIGPAADGLSAPDNAYGVVINGSKVTIGGTAPADRNLISGCRQGIRVSRTAFPDTVFELRVYGNLIGTDITGQAALPNGQGIRIEKQNAGAAPADHVEIGGTGVGEANVIAGNTGPGISVWTQFSDAAGAHFMIEGNVIGMDWTRSTALGNGANGIVFEGGLEAVVAENVIAHNSERGVSILGPLTNHGAGVVLTHNEIYENGLHGIDLGGDGRTANDADDSDTGANALLNFPVLTRVAKDTISGTGRLVIAVQAAPNTTYAMELFTLGLSSRPAGYDASGSFHRVNVTTNASGAAVYQEVGSFSSFSVGDSIVATLTDETRHYTSEISDPAVVAQLGHAISGTITMQGGAPLSGAAVSMTGSESRTALADANGDFTFVDLLSGGTYSLEPVSNGYSWYPGVRIFPNLSADATGANWTGDPLPTIYTVNVTHDAGDGWCSAAECTLAEAIAEANFHPGADAIFFSIPGTGPHAITLEQLLPSLEDNVYIDGYSQPGAVPNTNVSGGLNGSPMIAIVPGSGYPNGLAALDILGDNVSVRGLIVAGFTMGATVTTMAGGGRSVTFAGNYFGTNADGTAAAGGQVGILMMGEVDVTIGGTTPSSRNLISGHLVAGIISTFDAPAALRVTGNLIGTNAAGTSAIANGIGIIHSGDPTVDDVVRIGGDTAAARNVISGNDEGVLMMSGGTPDRDGSDKRIAGNYIGVAADGETPLGNTAHGISGCGELKLTIAKNLIAHNGGNGISLCTTPTPKPYGIVVTENAIYQNAGLAIDLEDDGRTDNDTDDSDSGANDRQNFPVLTSVMETVQGGVIVSGQLTSGPGRSYRIELFTSDTAGLPGQNARAFIEGFVVTTDAGGVASFAHPVTSQSFINAIEPVAATATDVSAMMTSELSDSVAYAILPRFGVSGTITFKGAPLSGVQLALTGDRAGAVTTGADGRYTFASLPMGGSYTVTPTLTGYFFTPPNTSIVAMSADAIADFAASVAMFSRYLSEGAIGPFWETSIAVLNGGVTPVDAEVAFLLPDGRRETITVPIAGPGHAVIDPATVPGLGGEAVFSTVISAPAPLVASRTMRWGGANGLGAHAEQALDEPRTVWYFGEGVTGCADLFYLLVNPGDVAADVQVTYALRAPAEPIVRTYTVGPYSRRTIHVNAEDGLSGAEVSAKLVVMNGQPIIAERSMYMSCYGSVWRGGHDAVASPAPAQSWYFAEGATGSFFDLYLLIANFESTAAEVEVEYLLTDGSRIIKPYVVAPGSRMTIDVANEAPQLADAAVSSIVRSTNNVPVIAERAQWWPDGGWYEGHVSTGVVESGVEWRIAGAQVGGPHDVHGYLLIANTGGAAGTAQVRAVFADGTTALAPPIALGRYSRTTISLAEAFPQAIGQSFGVIVESLGAQPAPIVVELSHYNDAGARFWGAGTNVVATRVR